MKIGPIRVHKGVCDASAAVFLNTQSKRFLLADDEDAEQTRLRVYEADQDGPPIAEHTLDNSVLKPDKAEPEIDIEGSAWLGERIFWVGSHGRSKKGKPRPSRHRLFATTVENDVPRISGEPYCTLIADLERALDLKLDIEAPPKKGGVSIEGLSCSPTPGELLIAFRNPLIKGRALVVPLRNAEEVVDHGAEARFGDPILLDLGGRGIRSMEYWPERTSWLLIAGPEGDGDEPYALMRWSGPVSKKPEELRGFVFAELGIDDGAPEGVLIHGSTDAVYVLFDEGNRRDPSGERCKDTSDQSFRSVSINDLLPPLLEDKH